MKRNVMFFREELVPVLHEEMDRHNRRCVGIICCNEEDEGCSGFITPDDVPDLDVDIIEEVDCRLRGGHDSNFELLDCIGKPCNCPEEFYEKDLGSEKTGMIEVACVDVRNGIIYLLKNGSPLKECNKPVYVEPIRGKMANFCLYRGRHRRNSHQNLKTMPESKLQRICRSEIRAIMGKF